MRKLIAATCLCLAVSGIASATPHGPRARGSGLGYGNQRTYHAPKLILVAPRTARTVRAPRVHR